MQQVNISSIILVYRASQTVSGTARVLGIDRKTVRKWVRRSRSIYNALQLSTRGLKRKSTRPHTIHKSLSPGQENIVVSVRRKEKRDQVKVAVTLKKQYHISVSPKTVYNIIKRKDPSLLNTRPRYKRPHFQDTSHMRPANTKTIGYLQSDVKYVTPELSGLSYTTYEYAFIDIHSRYKVALILPTLDQEAAIVTLRWMVTQFPFTPKFVQTDNGWEFSQRFTQECRKLGLEHYFIHKSTPNENAVIERSFRTDQDEFFYYLTKRPADINELNLWFQKYLKDYNEERPHFGIGLKTPLEVATAT